MGRFIAEKRIWRSIIMQRTFPYTSTVFYRFPVGKYALGRLGLTAEP